MIETINGKAYLKVGDKVYELGGGSNIITAASVEQLPDPASVPEGTIALVKSEEYEVFDFTGVFNYLTSIQQGGIFCEASYNCDKIIERLKHGAVKVRVAIANTVAETYVFAQVPVGYNHAMFVSLTSSTDGAILLLETALIGNGNNGIVQYRCRQVPVTNYVPS